MVRFFGLWLSQACALGKKLGPGGVDRFKNVHMRPIQAWGKLPNYFCSTVANSKWSCGSVFGYICSFNLLFLLDSLKN